MNKNDELDLVRSEHIGKEIRCLQEDAARIKDQKKKKEIASGFADHQLTCILRDINSLIDKSGVLRSGHGTVRDYARATILEGDTYWSEMQMLIDGRKVNMESVITYIDGVKCGDMYITSSRLPAWKRFIKRVLKI